MKALQCKTSTTNFLDDDTKSRGSDLEKSMHDIGAGKLTGYQTRRSLQDFKIDPTDCSIVLLISE